MSEKYVWWFRRNRKLKYVFWVFAHRQKCCPNWSENDDNFSGHCHSFRCSEHLKWIMSKPVFFLIHFLIIFLFKFDDERYIKQHHTSYNITREIFAFQYSLAWNREFLKLCFTVCVCRKDGTISVTLKQVTMSYWYNNLAAISRESRLGFYLTK